MFTIYASASGMMAPLGLAVAAPVADLVGVRFWYAAGGVACLAMGPVCFLIPSLARIGDSAPEPGQALGLTQEPSKPL